MNNLEDEYNYIIQCIDIETGRIPDDKDIARFAMNFVYKCADCNCCERHQINRPTLWTPVTYRQTYITMFYNCQCRCRQMSRIICNYHPNANP